MLFREPDPAYTASARAGRNFWLAIRLTLAFLAVIWSVFLFEHLLAIDLARFGLRPRESIGLLGLLTTPLLHGSFNHLTSNTIPLFVGGVAMLFLYPVSALRALPLIYLGSSALAWLFARPSLHIGASGLVYGMLAFVFVSGLIRRDLRSVAVSMMVFFFYGSMIWGVLPGVQSTSWELHLSGAVIGMLLAWLMASFDRPPLRRYDWEDEPDEPADDEDDQPWRRWD